MTKINLKLTNLYLGLELKSVVLGIWFQTFKNKK